MDMKALYRAMRRRLCRDNRAVKQPVRLKMDPVRLEGLSNKWSLGGARALTPPAIAIRLANLSDKRTDAYLNWLDDRLSDERDAVWRWPSGWETAKARRSNSPFSDRPNRFPRGC